MDKLQDLAISIKLCISRKPVVFSNYHASNPLRTDIRILLLCVNVAKDGCSDQGSDMLDQTEGEVMRGNELIPLKYIGSALSPVELQRAHTHTHKLTHS